MSMQRSFCILLTCTLLYSLPANAFFLDEINELFLQQLLSLHEAQDLTSKDAFLGEKRDRKECDSSDDTEPDTNTPQPRKTQKQPPKTLVLKEEDIRFNNIIGQDEAVANLRSTVEQFRNPSRLQLFGGEHKKGILLEGPPGTGKTMLARAIANELGYSFHECSATSFVEVYVGTGAQRVRELFTAAHASAPAVIFIDEIDAAAGKRGSGSGGGDQEYRQTTLELLTQMNKLNHHTNILVITATNCIEYVDEAFKAPHRFEIITIGLPSPRGRAETMRHYLNRLPLVQVGDDTILEVVEKTKGFSQSQLKTIVNIATQIAYADKTAIKITDAHIKIALEQVRNSMKTSIFGSSSSELDAICFNDIGGLDTVINDFRFLVFSLQHPERLKEFGVTPPKGILLVGAPGCGKTLLVRALANEASCPVISVSGGSFDTKYMGEGAQELRKIFSSAAMVSPAIIFIDEVDGITSPQSVNELLTQMDGFKKENTVIVIGATNHLEAVDYRLRREGRFSKIIPIELPDDAARRTILKLYIDKLPRVNTETIPYEMLVFYTNGFSGAAVHNIVNDAAMLACMENAEQVESHHFHHALERALISQKSRISAQY